MQFTNLDVGIRKALKAQFVARGIKDAEADAKVNAHVAAATKLFHTTRHDPGPGGRRPHEVIALTRAMAAVADWARTLK